MVASNGIGPRVDSIISLDAKAGHTYELKVKFTYINKKKYAIQWSTEDKGIDYVRTDAMYLQAQRLNVNKN